MKGKRLVWLGVWMLLMWGSGVKAQTGEEPQVKACFPAAKGLQLFVEHRFGRLEVRQQDTDSVGVEIFVLPVEQQKGWGELKSEAWGNTLKLRTTMDAAYNGVDDMEVRMILTVPEYVWVDLSNRYGSIYIPFFNAYLPARFTAVYGSLVVDTLRSSRDILPALNVSYGSLKVTECPTVEVRAAYARADIGKAANLQLRVEKSGFHIGEADTIIATGKYAGFEIGRCKVFVDRTKRD